jgi:hypothetical protein
MMGRSLVGRAHHEVQRQRRNSFLGVSVCKCPRADRHQNFEVLIRRHVSLVGKYCFGRVKDDLGFHRIEGDLFARGGAIRAERKALRNQGVYA